MLYIGRVNSRVTISQCVFTYNEASDRGGVAALIGSSLYINVNRTHILNNTARLGGIISACNSEVNVGASELFMSVDPVYSFCTLYNGDLINYNISTVNPDDFTLINITNAELALTADKNVISNTEYPFQSISPSLQKTIDASTTSSLQIDKEIPTSNQPLFAPTTNGGTQPLSTFIEPVFSSTSELIPSQLPLPSTSIRPYLSSQTSVLHVIAVSNTMIYSTSMNFKMDTQLLSTTATASSLSSLTMTPLLLPPLLPSTGSESPNFHFSSSSSGNTVSSTSLRLDSGTTSASNSNLKLDITMALVLVMYILFFMLVVFIITTEVLVMKKISSKEIKKCLLTVI